MIHPVEEIARRHSPGAAVGSIVLSVLAVVVVVPDGSPLIGVAIALGVVAFASADIQGASAPTELETARERYVDGEISLDEFESRAELILDDRAQEIREVVEEVSGVGPSTSASIAQEFDDVEKVRRASEERLRAIHGIGPSTAEALVEEVETA